MSDWMQKTIEPKSDQLNAEDLLLGPIIVTVRDVRECGGDQPMTIVIGDGRQPFKPCKTVRRMLLAIWGIDEEQWIGRRMKLYCDPDVMWGGVKVGGVRISHMSDIKSPVTLKLSTSKGKRSAFTIEPLMDMGSVDRSPREQMGRRAKSEQRAIEGRRVADAVLDSHRPNFVKAPKAVSAIAGALAEAHKSGSAAKIMDASRRVDDADGIEQSYLDSLKKFARAIRSHHGIADDGSKLPPDSPAEPTASAAGKLIDKIGRCRVREDIDACMEQLPDGQWTPEEYTTLLDALDAKAKELGV